MADDRRGRSARRAARASTRRERTGWYFYDWANSAFSTTVITVFLGPFLTAVTEHGGRLRLGADDCDGATSTRSASRSRPARSSRTWCRCRCC